MPTVLLLNLGGPESLEDVEPFLASLFSDPKIIDLPGGGLLRPLLSRAIARLRGRRVRRLYAQIGGGSPLRRLTMEQARALEGELSARRIDASVEVVMRYAPPRADRVARLLRERGEGRAVALPLYPQECVATTGSSLLDLEEALARSGGGISLEAIRSFHLHPAYLAAVAGRIREAAGRLGEEERQEAILLFSAHSVPEKLGRQGDPYVRQIEETVAGVRALLPEVAAHRLSYQSRAGPVRWVGPSTSDTIRELSGARAVLVVPISFVSDHIETLYEIDILFAGLASRCGIGRFERVDSLNDSPAFIGALADLVEGPLRAGGG